MFKSLIRSVSGRGGKERNEQRAPVARKGKRAVVEDQSLKKKVSSSQLFNYKPSVEGSGISGADRTLYSMPMPENVDAMTDLIKMHKAGDKFPYVGIVGDEGEDPDSRRARLLAIKPTYNSRHVPEIVVEACPLINTEGEFSMQDLMEFAKQNVSPVQPPSGPMPKLKTGQDFTITKKYIHIRSITALYTPNVSSTSDYCGFHILLNDTRLINKSKCGQSNSIVSNQEGVMEMSCDYCVSVPDLGSFVLEYQLEREIVKPSFQWGTLTFYFNITESDIPFQTTKKTALAVYRMPMTTLLDRETDADKSNIVFSPEDVNSLRKLFMEGDIVDVDQPQEARLKKSSYSKSTLRGAPKGEQLMQHTTDGWEMMKDARKPKMDALVASVSAPSENDDYTDDTFNENTLLAKSAWEKEQENLRKQFESREDADVFSMNSSDNSPETTLSKSILKNSRIENNDKPKKKAMFDENPSTDDMYPF